MNSLPLEFLFVFAAINTLLSLITTWINNKVCSHHRHTVLVLGVLIGITLLLMDFTAYSLGNGRLDEGIASGLVMFLLLIFLASATMSLERYSRQLTIMEILNVGSLGAAIQFVIWTIERVITS